MENTILNKEKFFALYWGQKVLNTGVTGGIVILNSSWNLKHPDFFLQLKSLQSITDEDALEISKIFHVNKGKHRVKNGKNIIKSFMNDDVFIGSFGRVGRCHDFLRSKGYLIGYNGLTPDQIISYGWAKTE